MGVLSPDPAFCRADTQALVLVGPKGGPDWWHRLGEASEWRDGIPDPVDRWSKRILGAISAKFGGSAFFPSDGPPYPPFQRWALATGRMWQSPVGMLVHAEAGLWVSFRGALALPFPVDLPKANCPCDSCALQPCMTACPVLALGSNGYDVPRCHAFLDTKAGQDCMTQGCAARRACPRAQSHARLPEQSAYHMRQFHP